MEYVITARRPFEETEALVIAALRQQGLLVQRTFSLRSAAGAAEESASTPRGTGSSPGYSVLMLYALGTPRRPIGLLTLYERDRRTVIKPVIMPVEYPRPESPMGEAQLAPEDADADLVAALVLGGLELCVEVARGEECITAAAQSEEGATSGRMIQDPVCGKWIDMSQAEAGIEHEGVVYHVCCALCLKEFEREPGRYARVG